MGKIPRSSIHLVGHWTNPGTQEQRKSAMLAHSMTRCHVPHGAWAKFGGDEQYLGMTRGVLPCVAGVNKGNGELVC